MSTAQAGYEARSTLLQSTRFAWFRRVVRFIRHKPMGAIGGVMLFILCFMAVAAPVIAPENPSRAQARLRLQPPNSTALLGRDGAGRDVLSRIIYGAQVSVGIGVAAVLISIVLKTAIGLFSAYRLGWTDLVIQRFVDAVQALPVLVVLMAAAFVFGRGPIPLIVLLGLLFGIRGSRVVRGAVLSISQNDYITAARALGASDARILMQHILPNVFAPIMVLATVNLGGIILTEATLSFLNLGLQPPSISWGQMLAARGLPEMIQGPWIAVAPGLCITASVWGINMLGDALRDILDPRLRGTGGGA